MQCRHSRTRSPPRSGTSIISGYTSYVAKAEIQNAQALLAELLTRIVEQFKPVVEISRLEGDAVFAYSGSSMPLKGETLMELIESTYIAFREGQEVYRRTLCDCEACQSLPMLELKFIIHHGEYAIQKVGDYRELIGSDVNLAIEHEKRAIRRAPLPVPAARGQCSASEHRTDVLRHIWYNSDSVFLILWEDDHSFLEIL